MILICHDMSIESILARRARVFTNTGCCPCNLKCTLALLNLETARIHTSYSRLKLKFSLEFPWFSQVCECTVTQKKSTSAAGKCQSGYTAPCLFGQSQCCRKIFRHCGHLLPLPGLGEVQTLCKVWFLASTCGKKCRNTRHDFLFQCTQVTFIYVQHV